MNILIDFSQIPIKKVGVGVYALNTFKEMFESHKDCQFFIVIQNDDSELMFNFSNVKVIKINSKIFRSFFFRLLIEQLYIPFLCRKYKIDITHSLHYSFPLIKTRAKKIVTIHDLTFFIYPKMHQLIKRYYFKWFIKKAAQRKDNTLICVSKSTLNDLKKYVPEGKSLNIVVPLACENLIQSFNPAILDKFNITQPYISFIGTLEPRKNIEGLIKAYSMSKMKEKFKLVIVGKKGWYFDSIFELVRSRNLSNNIIFTGFVTTEEKFNILKYSSLFIYPSFYEGFGLPVLEALSIGVPTITSAISSMPEVGGNAAVYINPENIEDIANAMDRVLMDLDLQKRMIEEGYRHSSKFNWAQTANKTFEIYNKCIEY